MDKYYVVTRPEYVGEVNGNSPNDAMANFAASMDTNMNLYFKAVTKDGLKKKAQQERAVFEVVGKEDSEFAGYVFAHCSSAALANAAWGALPKEFRDETETRKSNLLMDCIEVDGEIIDLREDK